MEQTMKIDKTLEYTPEWFKANAGSFSKWFDAKTFNWDYSHYLALYCSKDCKKWFKTTKTTKFNWAYSTLLALHCSSDFKKWFDADKYDFDYGSHLLTRNCMKHIDIWYDETKYELSKAELIKSTK